MADRTADGGVVVVGGSGAAGSSGEDVALIRLGADGRQLLVPVVRGRQRSGRG